MKTRSFLESNVNISAMVKTRRTISSESDNVTFAQLTADTSILNSPTVTNGLIDPSIQIINQLAVPEKKVIIKTLWTLEDKIMFFTALKNFGKNFNEISRFIKSRCSRMNPKNNGKTKEQVRVFYNRTWNNIKQYLKFPFELLQSVQELYALINYSVFRTRIKKRLNPKLGEKLNEMVLNGSTVIKCNGKRITLRTPVCPALKKINNIKAPEKEYTIPDDIIIEMVPRNYVTLWRVQQIEQNPRMRMKISVNRQLSDVINFLSNKLKSNSQILRESLSLPTIDPPKLHIRLSDDSKLYKEVVLQEVTKPRFDNITLKSYRDNILRTNVVQVNEKDPLRVPVTTSIQCSDDESSYLKMDFSEIQKKLLQGVGIEDAREVKVLALYIGLGCPIVIKFMYEYLYPSDVDTAHKSVSNGFRRMLHLGKHDYLEYGNNKDTKNKLEIEIIEMQKKLDEMKEQLVKMNSESGIYSDTDDHGISVINNSSGQYNKQDVYKKQCDALKQFTEDFPNKNNVILQKVPFVHDNSSIGRLKTFNKTRKHSRTTNKNKAAAVFTLKMPLNVPETHYQDGAIDTNDVMINNNTFSNIPSLYPDTAREVMFKGIGQQNDALYINNMFTEDFPNKNNVILQEFPFVHDNSSIGRLKAFNKTRKHSQTKAADGFTLEMPLNYQNVIGTNDVMIDNNTFSTMRGLYSDTPREVMLKDIGHQNDVLYVNNMINESQEGVSLDHCENTNDSLRSILNGLQFSVDGENHNSDFQNFYHNNSFFNIMNENSSNTDHNKQEDTIMSIDSNSGSLSLILNSYVKSDKKLQ